MRSNEIIMISLFAYQLIGRHINGTEKYKRAQSLMEKLKTRMKKEKNFPMQQIPTDGSHDMEANEIKSGIFLKKNHLSSV